MATNSSIRIWSNSDQPNEQEQTKKWKKQSEWSATTTLQKIIHTHRWKSLSDHIFCASVLNYNAFEAQKFLCIHAYQCTCMCMWHRTLCNMFIWCVLISPKIYILFNLYNTCEPVFLVLLLGNYYYGISSLCNDALSISRLQVHVGCVIDLLLSLFLFYSTRSFELWIFR